MNPLSTLRARRVARPHLLALAAVLALPATVGAQATNNWRCAGGAWNGDPVCWSLGRTPIASDNVAIPAGPTGSDLMLLHAIGNTVSMRQLTVGGARTEPSTSATSYLYASGSTINVTGANFDPGNVNVGNASNAYGQLSLTNGSTLNLGTGGGIFPGSVLVGKPLGFGAPLGIGALAVQGNSRINGGVTVYNGRLDVSGSSTPGHVAINGGVRIDGGAPLDMVSNLAGSVSGGVAILGGRVNIGTTNSSFNAPVLSGGVQLGGTADFVGRSRLEGFAYFQGGVTTITSGAVVDSTSNITQVFSGAQFVMQGGALNHRGMFNGGTVSGAGLIDSELETQKFTQQASGVVLASGGDLVIWGAFDGTAGGALGTVAAGRLHFNGNADFKAGQTITQSGAGGSALFMGNVNIGNATERGSLEAMTADLVLRNSSNLFLDFGSLGAGDHDFLYTAGQIQLDGGTLTLSTVPGAQFGQGASFNVLRATGGITGTFSFINDSSFGLAPGARLDYSNLYTTGTVAVVPEPATWLSLGAGLLLIGARARRWRQVG